MNEGKIYVAGIGPGSGDDITPAVKKAVALSDVVVGYKYYFSFIRSLVKEGAECVDTGMRKERDRAAMAFDYAAQGKTVCVISSGDAGIYGMAPLIWEMKRERNAAAEIEILPGISAFQKAAALLGAPIGHDFCVISLSDLLTPWNTIERRIRAAAEADFVTAVYNPKSEGRYWQLHRLKEIFLKERKAETPVGYVRQAGREEQEVTVTTLADFEPEQVDMFTVVLIGNSQSYNWQGKMITPRGYYGVREEDGRKPGQEIMIRSFRTIASELRNPDIPLDRKWALLHAIHTTADFDMEHIFYADEGAVESVYKALSGGKVRTIVTDVTMAASGIRKGALERLGLEVKCYLSDERVAEMAGRMNFTRTQSGSRLAVEVHPDALYVFGNAPTALMELCSLIRKGKAHPVGVVGAPVGFVNVRESKYMLKSFAAVPKIIVEGRKGGSNLAATIVNAILCFDDAGQLLPGRDL
ncbi:MAG: precorrin-3B C(17)-methyltransferase [Odoribacter sp.]|nr:precorrin-3B C(17)-methyltransferase [Odoribacter sp.]